ncbi:hypothetical protein EC991_005755 [Linnemannia zychae]|nr:hypothetical protein EC991_005755 [Linnemannia zychae]
MVFKSSLSILLVATLAVFSSYTPQAEAHSWMDCVNWKPTNSKDKPWTNGKCLGYARRYPVGKRFASLDSSSPNRHYQQEEKNNKNEWACSNGEDGEEPGADETRPTTLGDAYSTKSSKWGPMTVVNQGDSLCIRWPAKNHAGDRDGGKVIINLMKDDKPKKNYRQKELNGHLQALLDYSKCDKAKNSDVRPCGGCFKLESNITAGMYLLQWRWRLNFEEWYTSCADVRVNKK